MNAKLAPLVAEGRLDAETAKVLPDVLSAFVDGICVRLVLDDENSVSQLARNIETFLCRIVADGTAAGAEVAPHPSRRRRVRSASSHRPPQGGKGKSSI